MARPQWSGSRLPTACRPSRPSFTCSSRAKRRTSLATFNGGGAMFHKILVAVDGSRHASAGLGLGVEPAQRYGGSLCLLHAFPQVSDLLGTPYHEDLVAARTTVGRQLLGAARLEAGEAGSVETQLVEGP